MGKYTNLHRENSAFRKTERSKSSLSSWFAFVGRSFLLADWMVVSVVGNRLFLLVSRNSFLSPLHFSSLLLDLSVSEWPAGSKLLVVTVLPPWSLPSLKKGLSPFGKESTTLVALWECNAAHRRQKEKCGLWVPSREWGLGGLAVSSRRKYYLANEFFFFFSRCSFCSRDHLALVKSCWGVWFWRTSHYWTPLLQSKVPNLFLLQVSYYKLNNGSAS